MKRISLLLLFFTITELLFAQVYKTNEPFAHTFSIVARDSISGEMGIAVQSHWFSVGTAVSWAEAGVGAVATQSFTNKSFGIRGLNLLRSGLTAQQALESLLRDDEGRDVRQVAIIDKNGTVATHTGKSCIDYAGHIQGSNFSVQSNMMLTNKVPAAMADAFQKSKGKPLEKECFLRWKQRKVLVVIFAVNNLLQLLLFQGSLKTNHGMKEQLICV